MTSREFCYWLQGFFEINSSDINAIEELTFEQVKTIQKHLNIVFKHEIDSSYGKQAHQSELSDIHNEARPNLHLRC
jgi:hypothetical protein